MTTIQKLSEEILLIIFTKLDEEEVTQCQYVCRSWYSVAHPILLRDICLESVKKAFSFIASIDSNPNPLYLKSVKEIEMIDWLVDDQDSTTQIDKDMFSKLFFRFPNLQKVTLYRVPALVEAFDDELCKTFLDSCPKVDEFKVVFLPEVPEPKTYSYLMYRVRSLVTEMDAKMLGDVTHYGGLVQYLNSFPKLIKINSPPPSVDNFEKWFPILESMPSLQEITVESAGDDLDTFAEKYLKAKKSKQEKNLLVKSLSTIQVLHWGSEKRLCLNAIKFISRYMTGLKRVSIHASLLKYGNSAQQQLLCNVALGFYPVISECALELEMPSSLLAEYLPTIITTTLYRTATVPENAHNRRLTMEVKDSGTHSVIVKGEKDQTTHKQSVWVTINDSSFRLLDVNKSAILLDDIEEFTLKIEKEITKRIDLNFYDQLIKMMPSLKTVQFDIPVFSWSSNPATQQVTCTTHPHVKNLTLRVAESSKFTGLLYRYNDMFPNLEHLHIFYSSGNFKKPIGDFQIELAGYSLEKLVLDVTPVKKETEQLANVKDNAFFALEVFILGNSKRYLYKVPFDDINSATVMNDAHLEGLIRGKDYYRVYIMVRSLKKLELCLISTNREDYVDFPSSLNIYGQDYFDILRGLASVKCTAFEFA